MKVTVLRDNLKDGLAVVERVTIKSTSLPILKNILLVVEKNSLELLGTDLEIGIRYQILAKSEQEGSTVIPAKLLSQLIPLLSENQVTLEVTKKGLVVKTKNHNTIIKTLGVEDFPIIPRPDNTETTVEINTKEFCAGLNRVAGMTGKIQARPEISGVFFSFQKDKVKLVATDSFRLAEKTLVFEKENTIEQNFILPQKTARELIAVLAERPGKTKIYISPNQAAFDYIPEEGSVEPHIQIVSRLIEGEYPKYQDVIPSSHTTKVTADKNELIRQLRVASIFSGRLADVQLVVDPGKKILELASQSTDVGEYASSLPVEVEGTRAEGAFNWKFLLEGVTQIEGSKLVLGLGGQDDPVVIRPVGQEGYVYVVMPIRA